jgi:hypothetical protein
MLSQNTEWKPSTNNPDYLWKKFNGRMVSVCQNKFTGKWNLCVDGKWFNNVGQTRQEAVVAFDSDPARWMAEVAEIPQETEPVPSNSFLGDARVVSQLEALLIFLGESNLTEVRKALNKALDALRQNMVIK